MPCSGVPALTFWADYSANNQFVTTNNLGDWSQSYDAAGDVIYDGYHQYLYDGDGRVCAVRIGGSGMMTGYLYDADGARIAKGTISQWSCDPSVNGFAVTTDYVLGLGGEQVTEMQGGVWQHTNVFAAGKLMATYDGQGLHFYLDDPLGTRRAQTNYAGVLEQTCSSLPFGDELSCTGSTTSPTEHHFTGKERDAESGNDYFGARYYGSNMGRFMSPDWAAKAQPVPYAKLDNPQTLNLYGYVGNNPLSRSDPTGHYVCTGDQCKQLSTALATATTAAASDKLNADQKAALNKVISFYGKEGVDNKVTVNTGTAAPGTGGGTSTGKDGRTTITLDLGYFDSKNAVLNGSTPEAEKAGWTVHEGEHGVQQQAAGMPQSNQQEFSGEQQAYQTQSYVNQGLGVTSAYGTWTPTGGFSQKAVDDYATQSTQIWCSCKWTPTPPQ